MGDKQPVILKLTLLENSHSFLSEALAKAVAAERDPSQWKWAIFSLTQAIELSLKERLKREHPLLVFQNVDKPQLTVSLRDALTRLHKGCKLPMSQADRQAIHSATEWRNHILHFEFALSVAELKPAFAKLLGFIIHFHREHLDENLSAVIPGDLWTEAIKVQDYGKELFTRAQERFLKEKIDNDLVWVCLKCGWEAFVVQDDINTCYVCGTEEEVVECDSCHQLEYASKTEGTISGPEPEDHEMVVCRGCIDEAGERWADEQVERLIMERHAQRSKQED